MLSELDAMRADWNDRAREDANYYVAFGRRSQAEDEFFASAADVVRALETELKRKPASYWRGRRALEIGCGPGRLMRFMSRHFAEVHGVDISDEMVRRARENLKDFPNTYPQHAPNSDLSAFGDGSVGFVYSYAVFQHIPSRDVVLNYLREADRVLAPGGLMVFQINGLPDQGHVATTWNGARFHADEMVRFAAERDLLMLVLSGEDTQYMWVTLQKRSRGKIVNLTNAHTGERAIPARGRFGAVAVWVDEAPDDADLLSVTARIDGKPVRGCYVGAGKPWQFNFFVPPGIRTGLVSVALERNGLPWCGPAWARIIPEGPRVPRIHSISDGTNLSSAARIETGYGTLIMEEIGDPEAVGIGLDGVAAERVEYVCVDPLPGRYEFNFRIPEGTGPGMHWLEVTFGARAFAPIAVEVV